MFVIRNKQRDYNCYLNENSEWSGLLEAKVFDTKDEAEKVKPTETFEIVEWKEVVGLKN